MKKEILNTDPSARSVSAARISIAASIATLIILVMLHILSPEFNPSWRMVSEYALGNYNWVLSLMFICWALSSWTLAFAIRSQLSTKGGKIGLIFLIAAGVGEAMAAIFDISHSILHNVAGALGILGLPIAAMLISLCLSRTERRLVARKIFLCTANLTWISVVLFAITFAILIATYTHAGGDMTADAKIKILPPGVIALVGWANRLLIIVYCIWGIAVAWQAVCVRVNQ